MRCPGNAVGPGHSAAAASRRGRVATASSDLNQSALRCCTTAFRIGTRLVPAHSTPVHLRRRKRASASTRAAAAGASDSAGDSDGLEVIKNAKAMEPKPTLQKENPPKADDTSRAWTLPLVVAAMFVCPASFLFGYHSGVMNTPLAAITSDLSLSLFGQSAAVSALVVGGMAGALGCAPLSDKFGRKASLLALAIPLTIGTVMSAWASNAVVIALGRLMCGVGIGAASVLAPSLLAEVSPSRSRGAVSLLTRLAYVFGILVSYGAASYLQASTGAMDAGTWRSLFLIPLVPVAMLVIGCVSGAVPESPTWLVKSGNSDQASAVLQRVQGMTPEAAKEWVGVEEANQQAGTDAGAWSDLGLMKNRRAMFICTRLAVLQACSGSPVIVLYAATVFASAGLGASAATATLAVGVANLLGTMLAAVLTDRLGRKPLICNSFAAMALSLAVLMLAQSPGSIEAYPEICAMVSVAVVPFIMFAYALGAGPVPYLLYSELFAAKVRAKGTALCGAINWAGVLLLSATFLPLCNRFGAPVTFAMYAIVAVIAEAFCKACVFETKGMSLHEIEAKLTPTEEEIREEEAAIAAKAARMA